MNEKTSKALGLIIGGLIEFFLNWAILKWGWDLVLQPLVPQLPLLTWYQAFILMLVSGILFKKRVVQTIEKKL